MFDCIVVGAGPAGSTTAYALAQSGHRVLLLEKATLPRYKPCTGAVSPSIAQWFDFDFTPAIDKTVSRVRYSWKLEDANDGELTSVDPIWMVKRGRFDQFLVDQAGRQGAEIQDSTVVTGVEPLSDGWQVNTLSGVYGGRYLVAADGADGPLAGWLGFKSPKMCRASVFEVTVPLADEGKMSFDFGLVKQGCIWSFPKAQGCSVGISSFLGGEVKNVEATLAQYITELGLQADQGQLYHHSLKLWDGHKSLHCQRALLVGEAAALVDPLTAEGIRPAIVSGLKAADAISQSLAGQPQALVNYTQAVHNSLGDEFQWAQRIAAVFFRFPKIGYRVGIKRPSATERLGQLLAGDIHYSDIANRVIKRMSSSLIPGMGRSQ